MDNTNLLLKNIINKENFNKVSNLLPDNNNLAIPLGLVLSKNNDVKDNLAKNNYIVNGEVDNTLFEKLVNLVSSDNYKPKITEKDTILNIRNGKQLTRKKRQGKLNKSRKIM